MAINKVGSKGIEDGSVATADFAPGTVSSDKLQDNAVTNAKLTNSSITLTGSSVSLGGSVSLNNKFVDWQSVTTADGSTFNTAVSGEGYFIDTTSAAHTITLPASASIGDFIAIKDYAGTFGTNNLTIARNGHNIQGVANDSLISTNRASLVLVYVDSTKGWLYWEEHNVADLQAAAFTSATGGTVTTSGDYKIHTFTGDGCFVVSSVGNSPTVPTGGPNGVDYLVVAGGGGGGAGANAGGGGAGGFRASATTYTNCGPSSPRTACVSALTVSATTYPVTVGSGGIGGDYDPGGDFTTPPTRGSNSVFSTITSAGGGTGAYPSANPNGPGGSGGGAADGGGGGPAGTGNTPPTSPPQGSNGGAGPSSGVGGEGGGGAMAVGQCSSGPGAPRKGGDGGAGGGLPSDMGTTGELSGGQYYYAGGGGAGAWGGNGCTGQGLGGIGGGGDGVSNPEPGGAGPDGTAGTANTGGGGGGSGGTGLNATNYPGTNGGKGIVIIRYKFQ
jgi:hypothetical protein